MILNDQIIFNIRVQTVVPLSRSREILSAQLHLILKAIYWISLRSVHSNVHFALMDMTYINKTFLDKPLHNEV